MQVTPSRSLIWALLISLSFSMQAQSRPIESSPKIVARNLSFPSPVQWTSAGAEISLAHVVWGPREYPEILSKAREKTAQEHPTFDPDRPYVLALGFQAKVVGVIPTIGHAGSGLVRIKDTDGNIELPRSLTVEGLVPFSGSPGVYDLHFERNTTTEFWDFFPAAPNQEEFLFQVFPWNSQTTDPKFSFRIVLRDGDIAIVNVSPPPGPSCFDLHHDFAGTVGTSTRVKVHLVAKNRSLAGTEQYSRIGKTLRLRGAVDSLGNFLLEERYPENQVTAIFKGKFSNDCQLMQGYFSKANGSRLLPFAFAQVHLVGTQQQVQGGKRSQN